MARRPRQRQSGETAQVSEEDLAEALAVFNRGVERSKSEERAKRERSRADRARRDAAAELQRLRGDSSASPEQVAEADAAYREALDRWTTLSGEPAPPESPADGGSDNTPAPPESAEAGSDATPTPPESAGEGGSDNTASTPDPDRPPE